MIVRTKVAEQAEQFELDGAHYVGRRVLHDDDASRNVDQEIFHKGNWMTLILLQLDYDRGLMFVDPAILRPYQRPERLEKEAGK